jgi:hypothetical protein
LHKDEESNLLFVVSNGAYQHGVCSCCVYMKEDGLDNAMKASSTFSKTT